MKRVIKVIAVVLIIALIGVIYVIYYNISNRKYELNFIVDNEVYTTINTKGKEVIVLPEDPEKEGYVFDGWYLDYDEWEQPFEIGSLENEELTDNLNVYAKWNRKIYSFGEIKYNKDKKAISVHDEINANLFDIECLDANGAPASVEVSVIGEVLPGKTITVLAVAQAENYQIRSVEIDNIKVYGEPVMEIPNLRDYVNMSDNTGELGGQPELAASLFGITCKDSFGKNIEVNLTVKGEYASGKQISIVANATDAAGNAVIKEISDISVYGNPVIEYDSDKVFIKSDVDITSHYFSAVAQDSFGQPLEVSAQMVDGYQISGNTISVKLSATDSKGNTASQTIEGIKVYGQPVISGETQIVLKEDVVITAQNLGLTAYDSFKQPLDIAVSFVEGEHKSGSIANYQAVVSDIAGNVSKREISVKVYGLPEITVGRTAVKNGEVVDASTLEVTAADSFGEPLDVQITFKEGIYAGGDIVIYSISATDVAGNTAVVDDVEVMVYATEGITFSYLEFDPQAVKFDCCGEDLIAGVTDSFGNPCTFYVEAADGYTFDSGREVSCYVVATDAAGNVKQSKLFSNVKVYDIPTLHLADETKGAIVATEDELNTLFTVKDSFGEELTYKVEIIGSFIEGQYVNVEVSATDSVGNEMVANYRVVTIKEDETCSVLLYWGDKLLDTVIVDDVDDYLLSVPTEYGAVLGWYNESGSAYTDSKGKGIRSLTPGTSTSLYLYTTSTIYSVSQLNRISLTGKYILMRDLDLKNDEWTPIGTRVHPYKGTFDGNGHTISNFTISDEIFYAGLFGYAENAEIINLGIVNCNINIRYDLDSKDGSTVYAGCLVAWNEFGTVKNCNATGSVYVNSIGKDGAYNTDAYVGGLVGYNSGTVTCCHASVAVNAVSLDDAMSGGLVGSNEGVISYSFADGNVRAEARDYGNLYNGNTNPNTGAYAGGLVGRNSCDYGNGDRIGHIFNCYALGEASASATAYGGKFASASSMAGGLVGSSSYSENSVKNCFAVGSVSASASGQYSGTARGGGVIGNNSGTVENCCSFSGQSVTAESNGYSGVRVDKENLQSETFIIGSLGWHSDNWIFTDEAYPSIRENI